MLLSVEPQHESPIGINIFSKQCLACDMSEGLAELPVAKYSEYSKQSLCFHCYFHNWMNIAFQVHITI